MTAFRTPPLSLLLLLAAITAGTAAGEMTRPPVSFHHKAMSLTAVERVEAVAADVELRKAQDAQRPALRGGLFRSPRRSR